jgi:hypothetical protein
LKIAFVGQQDQIDIFTNLRRAVEHAGLPAHKQRLDAIRSDRRKDFSDRGRDQGCLPWRGIVQRVFRFAGSAAAGSNRAIPSTPRASLPTSCFWGFDGSTSERINHGCPAHARRAQVDNFSDCQPMHFCKEDSTWHEAGFQGALNHFNSSRGVREAGVRLKPSVNRLGPKKKRQRTAAVQNASSSCGRASSCQVLDCGSPLPLWTVPICPPDTFNRTPRSSRGLTGQGFSRNVSSWRTRLGICSGSRPGVNPTGAELGW